MTAAAAASPRSFPMCKWFAVCCARSLKWNMLHRFSVMIFEMCAFFFFRFFASSLAVRFVSFIGLHLEEFLRLNYGNERKHSASTSTIGTVRSPPFSQSIFSFEKFSPSIPNHIGPSRAYSLRALWVYFISIFFFFRFFMIVSLLLSSFAVLDASSVSFKIEIHIKMSLWSLCRPIENWESERTNQLHEHTRIPYFSVLSIRKYVDVVVVVTYCSHEEW